MCWFIFMTQLIHYILQFFIVSLVISSSLHQLRYERNRAPPQSIPPLCLARPGFAQHVEIHSAAVVARQLVCLGCDEGHEVGKPWG